MGDPAGDGRPAMGGPTWRLACRCGAWARPAALPILILAVLAGLDFLSKPEFVYLPLLSLGPAFGAVKLPPGQVALVGAVAAALWLPMVINDRLLGSFGGYAALVTIVGATVVGMAASLGRERKERELADVRAVADVAERVLLRQAPARVGEYRMAARYVSAAPSARIGGDVYDVVAADGGALRILVGDVQGKGLPAVKTASVVLAAFRESAYDAPGLREIADRIERSLERQTASEEFVTAVLAQIRGAAIEILNCGHPPPLLLGPGTARFAEGLETSLPLGLADLARPERRVGVFPFRAGEQVLFYTDGISEARNYAGTFYPLACRADLMADADPETALERLAGDVISHVGRALRDDAAMLLVRRDSG